MNKISKKPKQKAFGQKKPKSSEKTPKFSAKKSPKTKNIDETEAQEAEDLDDDNLRQSLNEMIKDFNQSNRKPKKKILKDEKIEQKFNSNRQQNTYLDMKSNSKANDNQSVSKRKRKMVIRTEVKWYEMRTINESEDKSVHKYSPDRVKELRKEAEELLRNDIEVYLERQDRNDHKKEDFEWIKTVLKSGTLADKLSAHTVLIQDSAVHNLRSVEAMLTMVNTKGKRECIMALDNLRELFIGDLLIPDKKLKTFAELIQYFNDKTSDKNLRNRQLVISLFEDKLKNLYRQFLDRLVTVSHDTVDSTKQKSLTTFYDLLVNNGEQEQFLLENVVNKIGDPIRKLAAQAVHLLNQLINQHHPFMKEVVIEEVERLLFRPNIKDRAQYYALCFLSEIIFGPTDKDLANKLIQLYFGFFNASIKKGDVDNKMMSVLITGVSRAFPYSKLDNSLLEDNVNNFYKLIHFVNPNTAIQALCLIFSIIDDKQSGVLTDRFYVVLYRQLIDIELDRCSRKAMFLNLVFRAMKRDPILKRVKAFMKRLLQIGLSVGSGLSSAILILISEVTKDNPALTLKKDVVISKVIKDSEGDDEEHYEDVPMSDDEQGETEAPSIKSNGPKKEDDENGQGARKTKDSVSWVHSKNIDINQTKTTSYDMKIRNPLYCGAELEELWELNLIKSSYHPSTALFAEKILSNEPIDYSGDPITDFSVKNFLDRFVFRNPKRKDKNISQSSRVFGRVAAPPENRKTINAKEYLNQSESRIPIDEKFIFDYMKQRVAEKEDNDSDGSVSDTEFDALLDRLEPMSKQDFAKDVYNKKKSKPTPKKEESDSEMEDDDDDGEEYEDDGGEDDVDFDADDPEFAEAFGDVDSDLEDALGQSGNLGQSKKRKKGFDAMTTQLFASADEFAEILEGNDSDSGLSDDGTKGPIDKRTEFRNRRKLGRKKKRKNPRSVDL